MHIRRRAIACVLSVVVVGALPSSSAELGEKGDPRHPERTVVYRLFQDRFERYVLEYEERYEAREG